MDNPTDEETDQKKFDDAADATMAALDAVPKGDVDGFIFACLNQAAFAAASVGMTHGEFASLAMNEMDDAKEIMDQIDAEEEAKTPPPN